MRKLDRRSALASMLVIAWAVLCIYFFIRYAASSSLIQSSSFSTWPFLTERLRGIDGIAYTLDLVRSFLGLLVFCAGCFGFGALALRGGLSEVMHWRATILEAACGLGTALIIGQGLTSAFLLALAEAGQLKPLYVAMLTAVGVGLAVLATSRFFPISSPKPTRNEAATHRADEKAFVAIAIVIGAVSLMYSSALLSYDAVALYFSDAKLTALDQSLRFFLNDSFVVSSFHTGIQYSALIQLFGDQSARMYSWASGLLIVVFGLGLTEQLGLSRRARLVLLAMLLSTTALMDLSGDGKIDLASTAPALAAVYWLTAGSSKRSERFLLLAGFLSGQAMADRPFNFALLPLLFVLFYAQSMIFGPERNANALRGSVHGLGLIAAGALPWVAFHLASNWIILGDPIAFLRNYTKLSPATWQWAVPPGQLWGFRVLYPFTVSFLNTSQSLGNVTPLFVAFAPLLFLQSIRRKLLVSREATGLFNAAIATLVIWIVATYMVFEIRYVLFLWVILFMPVAAATGALLQENMRPLAEFAKAAIGFLMLFVVVRTVYVALASYSPIDRQGNAQCSEAPLCSFLGPLNETAPAGSRVLTLNAFRYYLRTDLFACSTSNDEYASLQELSKTDIGAFWTEVYKDGFEYVAYEKNYTDRHLYFGITPSPENTPPWLSLQEISSEPGGREVTYRIRVTDPPTTPQKVCTLQTGIWQLQSVVGGFK